MDQLSINRLSCDFVSPDPILSLNLTLSAKKVSVYLNINNGNLDRTAVLTEQNYQNYELVEQDVSFDMEKLSSCKFVDKRNGSMIELFYTHHAVFDETYLDEDSDDEEEEPVQHDEMYVLPS